jgi:hypothetical protein
LLVTRHIPLIVIPGCFLGDWFWAGLPYALLMIQRDIYN